MKKHSTILSLGLASVLALSSCGKTGNAGGGNTDIAAQIKKERMAHNKALYERARNLHDGYTEIQALNSLLLDDSTNNKPLMDSLAMLYGKLNFGYPALKLADNVLAHDPENERMLEMKASGSALKGNPVEALNIFRKLYSNSHKLKYLFNMAYIEAQQKNYKDADATVAEFESKAANSQEAIEIFDPQSGEPQSVQAEAVVPYLKGVIATNKGDLQNAIKYLNEALKKYPEFVAANTYMAYFKQMSQRAAAQGAQRPK